MVVARGHFDKRKQLLFRAGKWGRCPPPTGLKQPPPLIVNSLRPHTQYLRAVDVLDPIDGRSFHNSVCSGIEHFHDNRPTSQAALREQHHRRGRPHRRRWQRDTLDTGQFGLIEPPPL